MPQFAAFSSLGLNFDGKRTQLDIIACSFHRFGVSPCNFSRLVGFIKGLHTGAFSRADLADKDSFSIINKFVDSYLKKIVELQEFLLWRNKIGGHIAITAPRANDNIATLYMSVVFPVSCSGTKYFVSEWAMTKSNPSGTHTSELKQWSLTEVTEKLMQRYLPKAVPLAKAAIPQS
jgi:hypothetical protein